MKRSELKRTPMLRKQPKSPAGPRKKKCAVCRNLFEPRSMTHKACSTDCAEILGAKVTAMQKAKQQRQERASDKVKILAAKPRGWWLAKTKKQMHLYVRLRDEGKQCCSCDTVLINTGKIGGDYDAGHLRSVGSAKHLEFDPRNVWGQCKDCNMRLHGNEREYERRLRVRIGNEIVDALLADQNERHLKIADLQAIEADYKVKIKELENGRN